MEENHDPTTFAQVAILEAPRLTRALAVDPSGQWLVVLNGRTATEGDSLYVYDLSTTFPLDDPQEVRGGYWPTPRPPGAASPYFPHVPTRARGLSSRSHRGRPARLVEFNPS